MVEIEVLLAGAVVVGIGYVFWLQLKSLNEDHRIKPRKSLHVTSVDVPPLADFPDPDEVVNIPGGTTQMLREDAPTPVKKKAAPKKRAPKKTAKKRNG